MNLETETVERAEVRAAFYHLLSQCFFQPTEDLTNSIMDGSLIQSLKLMSEMFRDLKIDREISWIEEYRDKCYALSIPEINMDLKVEYNRLFVGPGHLPSPPYESVYHTKNEENKDGLVMGDATINVKRSYLTAGVQLQENFTDLPDHIAVEFEFMSYLCNEETLRLKGEKESIMEIQANFLNQHLGSWITAFSDAVSNYTTSDFYRSIARIAQEWTHLDKSKQILKSHSREFTDSFGDALT